MENYLNHINQNSTLSPKMSFGILKNIIPEEIYKELIFLTDRILNQNSNDAKHMLAGRMYQGEQASILSNLSENFKKYILCSTNHYINLINGENYLKQSLDISKLDFHSAWLVSQYKSDYNPLHAHNGKISGVIYLKIPNQIIDGSQREREYLQNEKDKYYDGKINFTFNNITIDPYDQRNSHWIVTPEEKTMLIFPSWLMHAVYPYDGDGERRCISFNLI